MPGGTLAPEAYYFRGALPPFHSPGSQRRAFRISIGFAGFPRAFMDSFWKLNNRSSIIHSALMAANQQ
jgi:hypothetical protein